MNEKGKGPLAEALAEGSGLIKVGTAAAALFSRSPAGAAGETFQSAADADADSRRTTGAESPAPAQQAGAFGAVSVAFFGAVAIATGSQSHRIHRNERRNLLTYSKQSSSSHSTTSNAATILTNTEIIAVNRFL